MQPNLNNHIKSHISELVVPDDAGYLPRRKTFAAASPLHGG